MSLDLDQNKKLKRERGMNGFIYPAFDFTVCTMQKMSAVEWFKAAIVFISGAKSPKEKRRAASFAIDLFITGKWIFILTAMFMSLNSPLVAGVVIYLLVMNLVTYFWYHLWIFEKGSAMAPGRERRRFISLISAFCFGIICCAYIYSYVIPDQFSWPKNADVRQASLFFSLGNPLTNFYGDAKPLTLVASATCWGQTIMTFMFASILFTNSIPKTKD